MFIAKRRYGLNQETMPSYWLKHPVELFLLCFLVFVFQKTILISL